MNQKQLAACFAASILLLATTANSETGNQRLFEITSGSCKVKDAGYLSHEHKTGLIKHGKVDGNFIGSTKFYAGVKTVENEKGGFESYLLLEWTQDPSDGKPSSNEYRKAGVMNAYIDDDFFNIFSMGRSLNLSRTYKNEWHGVVTEENMKADQSIVFMYPIVCKMTPSVNNLLDLNLLGFKGTFDDMKKLNE